MSTAQIVPAQEKAATIRGLLEKMKPQISMVLPKHLNPDRVLRLAMTSIQKNPKLLECTKESLLGCIMQASQLGLELEGILGQAYLVPFRNNKKNGVYECQLIPGYRGLIRLALNTSEVTNVFAYAVFHGDEFDAELGDNPHIKHIPNWDARNFSKEEEIKENLRFVYAVAKMAEGDSQFVVLPKSAVERIRKRSRSSDDGPWVTDYEPMALKTAVKQLMKFIPTSSERLQRAVELDNQAEVGSQELDFIDISSEQPAEPDKPKGKLEAVKDQMKKSSAPAEPTEPGASKVTGEAEILARMRKEILKAVSHIGSKDEINAALTAAADGQMDVGQLETIDDQAMLHDILEKLKAKK